jgi:hypothetical protein
LWLPSSKFIEKTGHGFCHAPFLYSAGNPLSIFIAACVRQEGDVTGAFYRAGQFALVLGACPCLASRADFALVSDKPAQNIHKFVINVQILVGAELADLRFGIIPAITALAFHISHVVHVQLLQFFKRLSKG